MGLDIKRNRKGLYKAKASIAGQADGDWVNEDEFKKILIERVYFKFIEETIKIDMEFPSGYGVNDKLQYIEGKHCAGGEFIIFLLLDNGVKQ